MTRERYEQLNALVDRVLELAVGERGAFLDQACGTDSQLRQQVDALILAQESDADFLEAPALDLLAREIAAENDEWLAGRRISHYEVISRLGAGGSGEVWLARDLELLREVALKILRAEFFGDSRHVKRFQQEARASSSLNHPNVVTIYEIGEAEGFTFIAQEFVRGETLRKQLAHGALTLERAAGIVDQVAAALEATHAAGLVHRDIKPENIMVRPDGLVKVLDFGVARLIERLDRGEGAFSGPGVVIGTVKYMSPEQAVGREVDTRSDIFSLGVVLYELATGQLPFAKATDSETLQAIISATPMRPSKVKPGLGRKIDAIVDRCLAKGREQRYQSVSEMRADLRSVIRPGEPEGIARRGVLQALGVGALVLGGYGIFRAFHRDAEPGSFNSMRIERLAINGEVGEAAISPDGQSVVYTRTEAGGESLWIRHLPSASDSQMLPPQPGEYYGVTFSRDGRFLYYNRRVSRDQDAQYRLATARGEAPKLLADGTGPMAISPDGQHLAFMRMDPGRARAALVTMNAEGGETRVVASRQRPRYLKRQGLAWAADGHSIFAFAGNATYFTSKAYGLSEFRVSDGEERHLGKHTWAWAGSVLSSPDKSGVIIAGGERAEGALQIWKLSYPGGGVRRITNDLSDYTKLSQTGDGKTLLAVRRETVAEIWTTRPDNDSRAVQLTEGNVQDLGVMAWTLDRRLVFCALGGEYINIWIMDADGRNFRQLTTGASHKAEVAATRDGRYIVYQMEGRIWRVNSDGSSPLQLTQGALDVHPSSTADSRSIVFTSFQQWSPGIGGTPTLWKVPIDGGTPSQISNQPASLAQVSPDGERIACMWYVNGDPSVAHPQFAILTLDRGEVLRVFDQLPGSSDQLVWKADGTAVDYARNLDGVGNIWRQPLSGGAPFQVTRFESDQLFWFARSLDGRRDATARGKVITDVVRITGFG